MIEFLGKIDKLTHDWSTHKYVLGINDLIFKKYNVNTNIFKKANQRLEFNHFIIDVNPEFSVRLNDFCIRIKSGNKYEFDAELTLAYRERMIKLFGNEYKQALKKYISQNPLQEEECKNLLKIKLSEKKKSHLQLMSKLEKSVNEIRDLNKSISLYDGIDKNK